MLQRAPRVSPPAQSPSRRDPTPPAALTAARALALAPIVLTLLPLWRTGRGWVRIWDFPRVQIAVLGVIAQGVMLRAPARQPLDTALTAGLAASLAYQLAKILPFTPFYPRQVPTARRSRDRNIRFLMLNVLQTNGRADLVLRAIREADADVICLVETDAWWDERLAVLRRTYRWSNRCALGNMYGMLLYSRLPMTEVETRFRVRPDIPSMRAIVRLRSGDEIAVYAVHPRPPLPDTPSYGRDAELVLTGDEVRRETRPAVVIGDMNDVAWSYTTKLFQRIGKMLDPRVGRGLFSTFHSGHWVARYPLDHVFHTREFSVAEIRRLGYTGSDHFPILVELALTPSRVGETPEPKMTRNDREEASEILAEREKGKDQEYP